MDPRYSAQDVVRCRLCKTAVAPMCCNVCHILLCEDCVDKHLFDTAQVHTVIPLKQFLSTLHYPKCLNHPTKQCELHCKRCDVPICTVCISSGQHLRHGNVDISRHFEVKKEIIKRDLQELEKIIYPIYQEAASNIPLQKTETQKHSWILKSDLDKQREALHTEIDIIFREKQSKIDGMNIQCLAAINKQENAISHTVNEIKQVIQDLKSLRDTSDVRLVSEYKSRNEEFRQLPPKLNVTFPNFQPENIDREKLLEQFGFLSSLSISLEKQVYIPQPPGTETSSPDRPLLDIPRVSEHVATGYKPLLGVSCLSDEEIWTSGYNKIINLYKLHGGLSEQVQTKSGNAPWDITVTQNGNLVYTDFDDSSINLERNTEIKTLIRLRGWRPRGVCSTSCGYHLVIMDSDDYKETKVVRYSGSTQIIAIQWDDQGKPLYSSGPYSKYLSENRNFDICVADTHAGAVVVVSATGNFRFRYTGSTSTTKGSFKPFGITTDSNGKILIADQFNNRIHIVNHDGHFLCYIENCGLQYPYNLCVDSRDNLFVAEYGTGKVKKIVYYK